MTKQKKQHIGRNPKLLGIYRPYNTTK